MFDFEDWSNRVYRLTDLIKERQNEDDRDKSVSYEAELRSLWEEMKQSEDDMYVQLLNRIVSATKNVMNGKMKKEKLEEIMHEMRERALE